MKKISMILAGGAIMMALPVNAFPVIGRVPLVAPKFAHVWIDPAMTVATGLDWWVTKKRNERTIDAKKAIKKLQDAIAGKGGSGGGSCSGGSSGADAAAYVPEMVLSQIEVSGVSSAQLFENTRKAIQEYLFETSATDIKGDCSLDDKSCATQRQNEWLLASVTLASATADKLLDKTGRKVVDGQTAAEKPADEQQTGDTKTKSGGANVMTAHFQTLASGFNAETTPMGLYNRMAEIVLDTHSQINDANVLMGRDLEATSLNVITETGPEWMAESEGEE